MVSIPQDGLCCEHAVEGIALRPVLRGPECPIHQACEDWAETKAAYRFFGNQTVSAADILEPHRQMTAQRARSHGTMLAIQDTSSFVYTSHAKTKGLGRMSLKKGKHLW